MDILIIGAGYVDFTAACLRFLAYGVVRSIPVLITGREDHDGKVSTEKEWQN